MVQLSGVYENGNIKLDKKVSFDKPVKVIVTFMDENATTENPGLSLSDFSFLRSRELLMDVKTNISDAVLEERRSEL